MNDIIDGAVDKAVSDTPDTIEDPTDIEMISGEASFLPGRLSNVNISQLTVSRNKKS